MRDILGVSLERLKRIKNRNKRWSALLLILSLVVALDVFWILRQPGLTLAGDASCGIQEHTHDDTCGQLVCTCNMPEEPHIHSDACYETSFVEASEELRLVCNLTADPHEHNDSCYETTFVEPVEETNLICQIEDEEHIHETGCYETTVTEGYEDTVLICDLTTQPHTHTETCFETEVIEAHEERTLVCGLTEEPHVHEDSCYTLEIQCGYEEHVHSMECYSDKTADVETQLDWQGMFANYPYTGDLRKDLVGIAQTQVGYSESELNFEIDEYGNRRGYTRYGAWYGAPYSDWSAMFVSFCLNYAGADPDEAPGNTGAASMAASWNTLGKFASVGDYIPVSGDLVFFADNTVGIVTAVNNATFYVIRGDIENTVVGEILSLTDGNISGWGLTADTVLEQAEPEEPTEPEEPPEPEKPTEPEEPEEQAEPSKPSEEESSEAPELTQQETSPPENEEINLFDISNGPAIFIFEGASAPIQKRAMTAMTFRATRSVTEIIPYLESNGGTFFFTLLNLNNEELSKDENGNYIAVANENYKLTISFTSPEGFAPGTYQYQVPNGLMVDGGEGSFVLKDGTNVGSWVVTDTGLITLVFNEHMNSRTEITISATLGIHFPEQEDPIDFDGLITVTVKPPVQQENPTVLSKWGSPNEETGKINWTVRIDGYADSQIPGNILTDQVALSDWSRPHSYTESDIAGGLSFGASAPGGDWHAWHVSADDPHLIWDETGWSYKIPKTITCDHCGEVELGNEGWSYYINYTSTPTQLNTPGTFDYENKVTVDSQTAWGWSNFNHGQIAAEIIKDGSFVSDAAGGAFLWEVQVTIPGRVEGERAQYAWFISDEMKLLDENGTNIGHMQNDIHLSMVTATYNGKTIQIPRIQDATDSDMFAWDNAWTATEDGISHTRNINLLCRCQCTPDSCHWTGCGAYWFLQDDGTWDDKGFCQCWTETQNMTFTFVYKTNDLSLVEGYGSLGYHLNNHAQLFYMPDADSSVRVSYDDATVKIPNLFEKQLTHDFDGYTAHYSITVNEGKLVLTNGSPLYIHDEMTETLVYISGSLVITTEDGNGNVSTLKQGVDYTVEYDGTGGETDVHGKPVHVLDIVILHPQPVMYTLNYDTTLTIPTGVTEAIKYTNSAAITLWGEKITDTTQEKVYADINIAAKNYKVEMFKTCAQSGEPLGGATFGLYNAQGGLMATDVTDENGELVFQSNIIEGIILREHTLYYMQEIKAPPGYQLDDTKFWFCFCNETEDTCPTCAVILSGTDAQRIPFEQIGKVHAANQLADYDLPATGGSGIYPLTMASVMFIITPLVYEFIRRRKQERRGVG